MRIDGLTFAEIALQFGVSKQAVHEAVTHYLTHEPAENAAELRAIHNSRLERDYSELRTLYMAQMEAGKTDIALRTFDRILKVYERLARLNGLDRSVSVNMAFNFEAGAIPVEAVGNYRLDLPALAPPDTIEGEYIVKPDIEV